MPHECVAESPAREATHDDNAGNADLLCVGSAATLRLVFSSLLSATCDSQTAPGLLLPVFPALGAVVAQRAIGARGPIRKNYLVGALDKSDETELRNEICWPLVQAAPAD